MCCKPIPDAHQTWHDGSKWLRIAIGDLLKVVKTSDNKTMKFQKREKQLNRKCIIINRIICIYIYIYIMYLYIYNRYDFLLYQSVILYDISVLYMFMIFLQYCLLYVFYMMLFVLINILMWICWEASKYINSSSSARF